DLAVAVDLAQIVGRRDEREVHRPALARRARLDKPHVLGGRVELLEVVDRLVVGRELEVGAGPESEHRLGRRDAVGNEGGGTREERYIYKCRSGNAHAPSISQPLSFFLCPRNARASPKGIARRAASRSFRLTAPPRALVRDRLRGRARAWHACPRTGS